MFFLTQLIGIAVLHAYTPTVKQVKDETGNLINITEYNLPEGFNPPPKNDPTINLFSFIIALIIGVGAMFFLMRFNARAAIKAWFFVVISIALAISINAALYKIDILKTPLTLFFIAIPIAFTISLIIGTIFSYIKIYRRNIIAHNLSELLIYPGLASVFVPLLNIPSAIALFVVFSIYDMHAVWSSGIMQKMAKYQIQHLKVFSGFFIPYIGPKEKELISKLKNKNLKDKKIKLNVAILGGGDVVFPILLAGAVLRQWGLFDALLVSIGATLALALLFLYSKKGKFYPALPFIFAGCLLALLVAYLL